MRQDLQDFERNSQREIAPFVYLMYTHDYVSNIPTRAVDTVGCFKPFTLAFKTLYDSVLYGKCVEGL